MGILRLTVVVVTAYQRISVPANSGWSGGTDRRKSTPGTRPNFSRAPGSFRGALSGKNGTTLRSGGDMRPAIPLPAIFGFVCANRPVLAETNDSELRIRNPHGCEE